MFAAKCPATFGGWNDRKAREQSFKQFHVVTKDDRTVFVLMFYPSHSMFQVIKNLFRDGCYSYLKAN